MVKSPFKDHKLAPHQDKHRQVQFGRKSVWAFAAAREHTEASEKDLEKPCDFTTKNWDFMGIKH